MYANAFVRAFMRVPIKSVAGKNETKLNQRDNNWMHIEQSYEKPTEIIFFFNSVLSPSMAANPRTQKLEIERARSHTHGEHRKKSEKMKKKCWHSLDFSTTKLSVRCINCLLLRLLLVFGRFFFGDSIVTKFSSYRTKCILVCVDGSGDTSNFQLYEFSLCLCVSVCLCLCRWCLRQSTEHRTMPRCVRGWNGKCHLRHTEKPKRKWERMVL